GILGVDGRGTKPRWRERNLRLPPGTSIDDPSPARGLFWQRVLALQLSSRGGWLERRRVRNHGRIRVRQRTDEGRTALPDDDHDRAGSRRSGWRRVDSISRPI